MLSLSYSACYDPYNTIFRMLVILKRSPNQTMSMDVLRIADFFLCFPKRLSEMRAPNSVKGMRGRNNSVVREAAKLEYELLPSSSVLYERMDVIQEAAVSAMKANRLISIKRIGGRRIVTLKQEKVSVSLKQEIDKFVQQNVALVDLVTRDFSAIQVNGPNGLKDRTGLGEYFYDTV